ncbi:carboxypeptidase-like regulatory domain-containing protein [Acidicapsa ligni]|uniref:carboxypeptidase-like regulatory domain-containing protein n=1 Tax=Acidicapsa ligni TaxID=542300 RepID=UPI0021E040C2|nr:carboxypeptidase-like regulatory domain-containing protein [Acidicapsa ligni]
MAHWCRVVLLPALFVLSLASVTVSPAFAQLVGGTIAGSIVDSGGASVVGAAVVIRNEETGGVRQLVTSQYGTFSAPSIPVGTYTLSVTLDGFAPLKRTGIALTVGQSLELHLKLNVGKVEQLVTVVDTPSGVDTSTLQSQGLVNERQVKELPLNGRSFDQLLQLNPASISYTTQRSGGVGTSNSSVGNMYSISGRRPQDNLFLLNGIEYTGASLINVTPGGTSGQLLGVEAVREFNVVSDTYGANYGKRTGAQVSIITASGSNQVHGSVYEFFRNSALDARNFFDQSQIPAFGRNDYGAALGGPLRKDKLFAFGNYEGYRQHLGLSDVTFVPDNASRAAAVASVQPLLSLWPVGTTELGGGIAEAFSNPPQHVREDFGTTRVDANLTNQDLFFAAYTVDDSDATTPSANPYSSIYERLREQVLSAQEQHVFSPALLNTLRVGYSRAAFAFNSILSGSVPGWVAGGPVGSIVIAGSTASNGASQVTLAGANTGSNNETVRNLFTVDDHIYWTHGKHQIEAGVWLQRMQSNDFLAQNQYGQASFSTLATFEQGAVSKYTIVPSPTELGWRSLFSAGFIEDSWKATPRLELRAGIRIESSNGWNEVQGRASNYDFTNGVINTNPTVSSSALSDNRAKFLPEPRIGATYDLLGNGKTALKASFGLHRALLDTLDYRLDQTAPFNTTLSFSNTTVSDLPELSTGQVPGLVSPSNVQRNLETPTVLSWTAKVEQEIAPRTTLTIGYIGSHGYHQILSEDQNTPAAVICPSPSCPGSLADGTVYYPTTKLANPALANSTSWVSQGISNYNGLEVDVKRQFSKGLQLRGVYTWSKNLDDGSAWNTSVSANTPAFVSFPGNPKLDYGPAATNITHAAAINGTWELPVGKGHLALANASSLVQNLAGGWALSGIATLQSGFPFSPQLGYNPTGNGDSRNPARPQLNPDFHGKLYARTQSDWFNPDAFLAPYPGTFGNTSRDSLVGPGLTDVDLSLSKSTVVHDRVRAQFRVEYFNVLNHSNFTTPNAVVFSTGPTPAKPDTAAAVSPTAGVVTATATTSRQLQFALKFLF